VIIGISGHARHGKDTTADFICAHFGYKKKSLADPMKEACRVIFGWTDEHLYGALKDVIDPVFGISPRHALQTIGTQWGQFELSKYDSFADVTGRKLWVNSLLRGARGDTVIADVRFPHEAEAIRERGGYIIMIRRTGYPVDLTHESERGIEDIRPDFVIRNAWGLKELEEMTVELVQDAKIGF